MLNILSNYNILLTYIYIYIYLKRWWIGDGREAATIQWLGRRFNSEGSDKGVERGKQIEQRRE